MESKFIGKKIGNCIVVYYEGDSYDQVIECIRPKVSKDIQIIAIPVDLRGEL